MYGEPQEGQVVEIVPGHDESLRLEVPEGHHHNGSKIKLGYAGSTPFQKFIVDRHPDGSVSFRLAWHPNAVIDDSGAGCRQCHVWQAEQGNRNQHFYLQPLEGGWFRIACQRQQNEVLDIDGGGRAGAHLQNWSSIGVPNQRFRFVIVGGPQGSPYGAPAPGYGAPVQGYGAPAPGYGAPAPGYGAPAPGYGAPAPGYGAPAPGYGAPAPGYGAPAPGYGAPAPGFGAPAGNGPQEGQVVEIVPGHDESLRLEVPEGHHHNGSKIKLGYAGSTPFQRFIVDRHPDGSVSFRLAWHPNAVIDDSGAGCRQCHVWQAEQGNRNQHFYLQPLEGGWFRIACQRQQNEVLDIDGGGHAGAHLQNWSSIGVPNQRFRFVIVGGPQGSPYGAPAPGYGAPYGAPQYPPQGFA